ncbi:MAG: hypothetical protein IM552_10600 [Chitinophagaceae bacterium]|jgi:hypothetical protein|nr:hypothetical protein [Chitinophagaceae bacterium]
MAALKFRIYLEEDDTVYRDIVILHNQPFFELHLSILKSFEFDQIHGATFYRSNDNWARGREISLERYDKDYRVEPLIMKEVTIGSEIKDTNQKFVYEYDFNKHWIFLIELINVSKEINTRISYPAITRTEGIGPQQYGTKSLLGNKFADIEEKYDLSRNAEGFGSEGEEDEESDDNDLSEATDEMGENDDL